MFNSNAAPSIADIAAVTGGGRNNGDFLGEGWWPIILILLLFGWGRNGFGYGGVSSGASSCCTPATCAELQSGFNNQAITNKLNGLENGLSSLGYDQLAQMNNIGTQIQQGNFGLQQAINNMGVAQMQDANALSRQLSDCCCENRAAIKDVQYNAAMNTNTIVQAIGNQTQQIIQNDNANYRALHDEFVQFQMSQKDDVIAELRSQVQALNLSASQSRQNEYLVGQLKTPCPIPAYQVPNPNCCYGQQAACGNCY